MSVPSQIAMPSAIANHNNSPPTAASGPAAAFVTPRDSNKKPRLTANNESHRNINVNGGSTMATTTAASGEVSISGQSDLAEGSIGSSMHHRGAAGGAVRAGGVSGRDDGVNDDDDDDDAHPPPSEYNANHQDTDDPSNEINNDDLSSEESEPNWPNLTKDNAHLSALVPPFLASRTSFHTAATTFAHAMDDLASSSTHNIHQLVSTVSDVCEGRIEQLMELERQLKNDFVYIERMRGGMERKLERVSRAAQGYFASLLMRVGMRAGQQQQMHLSVGGGTNGGGSLGGLLNNAINNNGDGANGGGDQKEEDDTNITRQDLGDTEPNWSTLTLHEPNSTSVPLFLSTRNRRIAADERFSQAIEIYHSSIAGQLDELAHVMADTFNENHAKLEEYEIALREGFVVNDEMRGRMLVRLEESKREAMEVLDGLMGRVRNEDNIVH
ncbi:predicted protein [Thalassiosira pseudonana CCMP1335]|uniref:Uncharacterized protein n=1 Tax=Thalassiosira pseudonana TaxID=35128 RepID=B8BZW2_THAPS|nr:predicted protein [Thalassiosira pseudonana CCMP1335]EED92957.1 predicted protein [Thalassiosira pseudonana CCMP1335]